MELLPVTSAMQSCAVMQHAGERMSTRQWCVRGVSLLNNTMLHTYCCYAIWLFNTFTLKSNFIMARLSQNNRHQAIGMILAGMPTFRIAQYFNVHPSTITRLRRRHQTTGSVADIPRHGRPRVTSLAQDRYIRFSTLILEQNSYSFFE